MSNKAYIYSIENKVNGTCSKANVSQLINKKGKVGGKYTLVRVA